MAERIRILGIDPGTRITGYGVIDKCGNELIFVACGVIKTDTKMSLPARLTELHRGLAEVIDCHRPDRAAIEDIFVSNNPRSALKLGQARGALIVAVTRQDIEVHEYTPRSIKQAVAGYGQASKEQVQHMVRILLKLTSNPSSDAADALAVALCHANHLTSANLVRS